MKTSSSAAAMAAFLLSAVLVLASATPALAESKPARQEIEKIIEEYIMSHPEVIERSMRAYVERMRRGTAEELIKEAFNNRKKVDVGASPSLGDPTAPVTIVVFSDFQCPYCAQAVHTMKDLRLKYGGIVRFVYKFFPLDNHPEARPTAKASLAAQKQGKFWEYHDQLMARQVEWGQAQDKRKMFAKFAAELGMDEAQFEKDLDDPGFDAVINKDFEQGKTVGVGSTPTFFLNGVPVPGAQDISVLSQVIDALISPKK